MRQMILLPISGFISLSFFMIGKGLPIFAHVAQSFFSATVLANPTPTATPSSQAAGGGLDSTTIAAIIGLGGVLFGVGVAIWTTLYQARRGERFQREVTQKGEQLQRELARQNEQLQRDLVRTQKELEREYADHEREEHNEEIIKTAEVKKQQMLRASTNDQRAQIYRDALQEDPRISTIKILDMKRPLETVNVYVRLRLHQDTQLTYREEALLVQADPIRDPNMVFQADRKMREQRSTSAIDPEEALRTYTRCVLLGDPGAGKTTLLRYLALTIAKQSLVSFTNFLPIYIELNAFVNAKLPDLLDYCALAWDGSYAFPHEAARRYIGDQLHAGKAILLLDALDETVIGETAEAAERSYAFVSHAILQVTTRYPKAPVVVTARKAGYQQRAPLAGFTELDVLDFRPDDIRQFIDKWYTCSRDIQKDHKIADLTLRLERNAHLQALAANPLLLSLTVLVYEAELDLPDRRADLYKRCVETLLSEWDARRNIRRRRQFQPEHKRQLLASIAWHFHVQGQRYFAEQELLQVIADFLPTVGLPKEDNQLILQEIEHEQGLLKEQAQGWHGFVHLTLQEYFAALAVTDDEHLQLLLKHRANAWWEEVFLLYAGSTSDASALLQALLKQDGEQALREDIFATNIILAGRCLGAHPTVRNVSLREQVRTRLFNTLKQTRYTLLQTHVAEALAGMRDPQVNKEMIRLLSDARIDSSLRGRIADALGSLGERSVAPDMLRLLSDPQLDKYLRGRIADALGRLGEQSVVPDMLRLLSDPQLDLSLRRNIASTLGRLGERGVASDMLPLLSDAQIDLSLRGSIASALGRLGERNVASDMLRLLSDPQLDSSLRGRIAEALGSLGERSVVPDMLRLLSDPELDSSLRGWIADALGRLGERSVIPDMLRLLSDARLDSYLRRNIASALVSLGERSGISKMLPLLSDARLDLYLRRSIADTLGSLGERSIAPDMLRLLSDARLDSSLRGRIADALGSLGERSVAPDMLRLLSDPQLDKYLRGRIADALGRLGEQSVVPDMLRLLSDPQLDSSLRGRIAEALGNLGERSVVPDMLRLLSDPQLDKYLQRSVTNALGNLALDLPSIQMLTPLLLQPSIANMVYGLLWTVSRKAGVSIFSTHGQGDAVYEVVPWDEPVS